MKVVSATKLNKHSGQILQMAQKGLVIIKKTNEPSAVIISYEYFTELEDYYFGSLAKEIEKSRLSIGKLFIC